MIEVYGNIWAYKADFICVTTNGSVNRLNQAVMGRGVAKQAAERYPWIRDALARYLCTIGLKVTRILPYDTRIQPPLIAFPVKHHWNMNADLNLIQASAQQLDHIIMDMSWQDMIFALPKPGCGNGGLRWEDVKPVIDFLPDNVHVIDLKEA